MHVAPQIKPVPKIPTPVRSVGQKPMYWQEAQEKKQQNTETKKLPAEAEKVLSGTISSVRTNAKRIKKHESPEKKVRDTQKSAVLNPSEANKSVANRAQIETMAAQKKEKFNALAFKSKLNHNITLALPTNKSLAEKFKKTGISDTINKKIADDLAQEKAEAGGAIEQTTKQTPQVPEKERATEGPIALQVEVAGIQPNISKTNSVMPTPKPYAETNMNAEAEVLNSVLAKDQVSETQLSTSNEPQLVGAVKLKTDAQTKAKAVPIEYKNVEQPLLKNGQTASQEQIQNGMMSMYSTKNTTLNQNNKIQIDKKLREEAIRKQVAGELNKIYDNTKTRVDAIFTKLDQDIATIFEQGLKENQPKFESEVQSLLDDNEGFIDVGLKRLKGEKVLNDTEVFQQAQNSFIAKMDTTITSIANLVETSLQSAVKIIEDGKKDCLTYWNTQGTDVKKIAQDIFDGVNSKYSELEDSVEKKETAVLEGITQKYNEALLGQQDKFLKIREETQKSWLDKAQDAIVGAVQTILDLRKALKQMAAKASKYADRISNAPIEFFNNLATGLGQGFTNFKNNIDTHLIKGVLQWLTGSMASIGLNLPEKFDFEGIVSIVLQVLGITMAKVKAMIIAVIGEKRFEFLEKGVEASISAGNKILNIFKILNEKGIAGLWEFIKEEISDLKEKLIDTVKNFIIDIITKKALELLLSMLIPAAGLIKAVEALINFVSVLFQKAEQIIAIINGIIDTFGEILNKNVAKVAKMMENVLSGFLSLAISFLAAVLGLNGITKRVQKVIEEKIQPQVDKALAAIAKKLKIAVEKIGLNKLIDKSMAGLEKGKDKFKDAKNKFLSFLKIKKIFKTKDGHTHTLFLEGTDDEHLTLMVASDKKAYNSFLDGVNANEPKTVQAKSQAKSIFIELLAILRRRYTTFVQSGDGALEYEKALERKYDKVNEKITPLSEQTLILFDSENNSQPLELIFGGVNKDGFATSMEVKNLNKKVIPPVGSVPGVTNNAYNTLKKRKNGDSTYYILGHLLNHNLGGTGRDFRNLTPLSRAGNKKHLDDVESKVKKLVDDGKTVNYKVVPKYDRTDIKEVYEDNGLKKEIRRKEIATPLELYCEYEEVKSDGTKENKKTARPENKVDDIIKDDEI